MTLEIFIDREKPKVNSTTPPPYHKLTAHIARSFKWLHGPVTVHLHEEHVGLYGQWINSWRPKENTTELALFLEDDIDVSPYAWKWLKAAYHRYRDDPEVFGIGLKPSYIVTGRLKHQFIRVPRKYTAFKYKLLHSHGFAPLPHAWRRFQDWYYKESNRTYLKPYVPNIIPTLWYKRFQKRNTEDSMWTMWAIYYMWQTKKFAVFPNFSRLIKRRNGALVVHRREKGLHFKGVDRVRNSESLLLNQWLKGFSKFPRETIKYDWDGHIITKY